MRGFNVCIGLCLSLFYLGCSSGLSPMEFIHYVNAPSHGLIKQKTVNGIEAKLQFRPIPYVIALEAKGKAISQADYDARFRELEGSQYYQFRLAATDGQSSVLEYGIDDPTVIQARKQMLMYQLKDRIHLVCEGDTIRCKLAHFEQTYGITPYANFLLAFPEGKNCDTRQLILEDIGYRLGTLKFTFDKYILDRLPSLSLK